MTEERSQRVEETERAFARVQAELIGMVDRLNAEGANRYTLTQRDHTWTVNSQVRRNINDGARFDFDIQTATLRTQPTVGFSFDANGRHTFVYDTSLGLFTENGHTVAVSVEDVVALALKVFLQNTEAPDSSS